MQIVQLVIDHSSLIVDNLYSIEGIVQVQNLRVQFDYQFEGEKPLKVLFYIKAFE